MTTADLYIVAKPVPCDQVLKEETRGATQRLTGAEASPKAETETRLWKVCAEASFHRFSAFEWMIILLFGAVSFGALACGFFELFNSGALDEAAQALLTR